MKCFFYAIKGKLLVILFFYTPILFGQKTLQGYGDIIHTTVWLVDSVKNFSGSSVMVEWNGRYFLITAEHVSLELTDNTSILFSDSLYKPKVYKIRNLTKEKFVVFKKHSLADVAGIEISLNDSFLKRHFDKYALTKEFIPEYNINDREPIGRSEQLVFFGFPIISEDLNLYFAPFSFKTYPSSGMIRLKRLDYPLNICKFFLAENPGMQGYSGGPVFSGGENSFILRGIVHGTKGDVTGGKLAMITPAEYILELLNQF